MNPEIVNIYIEKLINEIQELIKTKILIDTQLKYSELVNQELSKQITDLQAQVDSLTIQLEKKKINKKEVNTSVEF